jgi:hypothetical protein
MPEAYGTFGKNPLAYATAHVLNFIQKKKLCTRGELMSEFWHDVSYADLLKVTESLVAMGKIKVTPTPTGDEIRWKGGK